MKILEQLQHSITLNKDTLDAPNLCDRFTAQDLDLIGRIVTDGYKRDEASRFEWYRMNEAGMDLAMQVSREKTFPWANCANVLFPLVTIGSLQFSSRSYSNLIKGTDIVRYRVVGADPKGELIAKSRRIAEHMSWQVLEEDSAWEDQHDKLLINLSIVGDAFIKSYFSSKFGHNVSELVTARDLIVNYWAKSLVDAPRITHRLYLSRNDIYERVKSDLFKDWLDEAWYEEPQPIDAGEVERMKRVGLTPPSAPDQDTPMKLTEQQVNLDLDRDGYNEPYIITVDERNSKVWRIAVRAERQEQIEHVPHRPNVILRVHPTEYFTKYNFIPSPEGGFYGMGFGRLLGPLNESVNTGVNQLLDAGTMANSNGGFIGKGVKFRGGVYTVAPFTWTRVDNTGDDLRKSMVQLPTRDPSNVMFQLIGFIVQYADRLAGTVDQMVGENPGQNTPAETSRNTLEQGMELYSSIYKRIWRSMKDEFRIRHKLNAFYLSARKQFGTNDGYVLREDYKSDPNQVVPVADPKITSRSQRIQIAAAVREAAHTVPGYDIALVEKNYLRAMEVEDIEHIYPGPDKTQPLPNPKVQVEQMKLQGKSMQLKWEQQKFMLDLQEQRKLNQATILQLQAAALHLIAEIGDMKAEQRLAEFNATIDAMKKHGDLITSQIDSLAGAQNDDGEGGDKPGGVPRLAGPQGNPGNSGGDAQAGGNVQGAMGG